MSTKYVTHQFAHMETLDRAARWLRQVGFESGQIEVHRDGMPWISVMATPDQVAEAEAIFKAAEVTDPDGWPSFWDLAKFPHPHLEPDLEKNATESTVVTAHPSPIGWHPPDVADTGKGLPGVTEVVDVSTRFGSGTPPNFRKS